MRESQSGCCCCDRPHLTEREIEVLRLVAAGYTNGEAAKILRVSIHTVVRHMTVMLRKTDERCRAGLVASAYAAGILVGGPEGPQATGRRCLQT
jgi:DNA-binding CsgD family transcriptional regulator